MVDTNKSVAKTAATNKRVLEGIVISNKMAKTIVVNVEKVKIHPKYNKRYKSSKHYQVHDETNKFKVGDKVRFIECRPLSKTKRWRVLDSTSAKASVDKK